MNSNLDQLILGVNPFSNVDHFLRERARERSTRLDKNKISETLLRAFESGARGFNFATDETGFALLKNLGACGYNGEIGLYPMIPDTQTYVSAQLAGGTMGVISQALGNLSLTGRAKAILQGGLSIVTADPIRAIRILIDVEINRLLNAIPENAKLRSVLIHDSITDTAIALGASEILQMYADHVWDSYKVWPGFVTRNFPFFVEFCERSNVSLDRIVIMTPFNRMGFQMTPTREACEKTLANMKTPNVVAMSILAGGQLGLNDALGYLANLRNLKSVVVGTSSPGHAKETFGEMSKVFSPRGL
jgi:hypothetical protein